MSFLWDVFTNSYLNVYNGLAKSSLKLAMGEKLHPIIYVDVITYALIDANAL